MNRRKKVTPEIILPGKTFKQVLMDDFAKEDLLDVALTIFGTYWIKFWFLCGLQIFLFVIGLLSQDFTILNFLPIIVMALEVVFVILGALWWVAHERKHKA